MRFSKKIFFFYLIINNIFIYEFIISSDRPNKIKLLTLLNPPSLPELTLDPKITPKMNILFKTEKDKKKETETKVAQEENINDDPSLNFKNNLISENLAWIDKQDPLCLMPAIWQGDRNKSWDKGNVFLDATYQPDEFEKNGKYVIIDKDYNKIIITPFINDYKYEYIISDRSKKKLANLKKDQLALITYITITFFKNVEKNLKNADIIRLDSNLYKIYQSLPVNMQFCIELHYRPTEVEYMFQFPEASNDDCYTIL